MTEQQRPDLARMLDVLIERVGDLGTRVGDTHSGLSRRLDEVTACLDDMQETLSRHLDDLRTNMNTRFDQINKLSIWVRGLLIAIALLLAKIAFFPAG